MLRYCALLCAALLTLPTSHACASTVHPTDPRAMFRIAGVVFAGTVSRITGENDPAGRTILTRVILRELTGIKGELKGDSLALRLEGGRAGSRRVIVSDQPEFEMSKRYVIFAHSSLGSEADAFNPIVRMHWGLFPIEAEGSKEKKCVHDWMHRPLIRMEADRVIVMDASMDSTGQGASRDPFVVLGRKEDPRTRVSEKDFIGFLRALVDHK